MAEVAISPSSTQEPAAASVSCLEVSGDSVGAAECSRKQPQWRAGPHFSFTKENWMRQTKIRQKFNFSDKLAATLGASYNRGDGSVAPLGSLIWKLDKRSRIEATEQKIFVKKGWDWSAGNVMVGLSAECGYIYRPCLPHQVRGPDLHLSLDYIKPLKWELLGIGAVLLFNLPFKLKNKEFELPLYPRRIRGFVRGSLNRSGFLGYHLDLGETSAILEL